MENMTSPILHLQNVVIWLYDAMMICWYKDMMIYDDTRICCLDDNRTVWWYEHLANPFPGNHCVPHSLSETCTQPPTTLISVLMTVMANFRTIGVMTCLIFGRQWGWQQRWFKTYGAVYLAWGSVEDGDCHHRLLKTNITMTVADYDDNDWRRLWWWWLKWRWLEQTSPILRLAFATLSRARGGSATQANKLGLEPILSSSDFHCFHMCLF